MKRRLALTCALLVLVGLGLHAQDAPPSSGRAIILVQDISPSISPSFPKIQEVLANALINERLGLGDYFALITFSGDVRNADGAKIEYPRDKEARSAIWKNIKPEGAFTDIGKALRTALETSIDLRNRGFSKYEPLVLFLTDGEHEAPPNSPFAGKSVDQLFEDPLIGDPTLYSGWYFVGIGKDLKDIKRIASLAGRESAFLSIEDPASLESALDAYIRGIPSPAKLEDATISVSDAAWGKTALRADKMVSLPSSSLPKLNLGLISDFKAAKASLVIKDVQITFQSVDHRDLVNLSPAWEKGRIVVPPSARVAQNIDLAGPGHLVGRGTLKLDLKTEVNHRETDMLKTYEVAFMSPWAMFWSVWLWPVVGLVVAIILVLGYLVLRKRLPAKVTMEVLGGKKSRFVSIKVGGRVEFGGKAALQFRLDGPWAPVLGSLRRRGPDVWEIEVRNPEGFLSDYAGGPYKLGTLIKLVNQDGSLVSVKFQRKK